MKNKSKNDSFNNNINNTLNHKVLFMAKTALIAALYYVLTIALAPISYGIIQFRISETLTVLPVLMPEAVPGLFLGCLIANLLNPGNLGIIDIVFGSLASVFAALSTYYIARKMPEIITASTASDKNFL